MPQSAAGRTIMTTEPKFVPEEAVEVNIGENASFRVRMIDCVAILFPAPWDISRMSSRAW